MLTRLNTGKRVANPTTVPLRRAVGIMMHWRTEAP
jgi:hypothetical protein